jgi:hypothetical protein
MLPASLTSDLTAALDSASTLRADGARDKRLARTLDGLAKSVAKGDGDAITQRRRSGLANTLKGIAAGLR